MIAAAGVLVPLAYLWQASLLPDTYDLATMGYADWGGGPHEEHGALDSGTIAVADLVARPGSPDVRVRFEVAQTDDGYTVNGHSPGPAPRRHRG